MLILLIQFGILIYSVILHEISHGWVAEKLGDPTARLAKRLTLDPRPHTDLLMTILLPLLLFLTHAGIIFGAAKPVPIDPFNFRDPKKDTALVALAGPLTNLLIAILLSLALRLSYFFIVNDSFYSIISNILTNSIIWNVGLALFNLFPLPPLDGFKVLTGLVSDDIARDLLRLERFGFTIIFIILFLFPGIIFGTISPIMRTITSFLVP